MRIKNEGNCKIIGKVAHFSGCARWAESVRSTREQICPIGEQNFYVVTAILRTLSFVLTNGRFVRRSWPFCMFQLRERAQFQSVQIVPEKKKNQKSWAKKKRKTIFLSAQKKFNTFWGNMFLSNISNLSCIIEKMRPSACPSVGVIFLRRLITFSSVNYL